MNSKIKTLEELLFLFNKEDRVVFTDGVCNGLHVGHLKYFYNAKQQGTHLVVGIYADDFVLERKGEMKLFPHGERMEALDYLNFVDHVVLMDSQEHKKQIMESLPLSVIVVSSTTTDDKNSPDAIRNVYKGDAKIVELGPQAKIHTKDIQ